MKEQISSSLLCDASVDAFYRLRVSTPHTIFDSAQVGRAPRIFFDSEYKGEQSSVNWKSKTSSSLLTCSGNIGDYVISQTYEYFPYQSGKSQLVMFSAIAGQKLKGFEKRMGLFTDTDGIFFLINEDGFHICLRSSVTGTDIKVHESNFSEPPCDIDITKGHIFFIDYEWLGVGRIRIGIMLNGKPRLLHCFDHFNQLENVYMRTPNLPLRYSINCVENSNEIACMTQICSVVITEGVYSIPGFPGSITTGLTPSLVDSIRVPVLSIRLKSPTQSSFYERPFVKIRNAMLMSTHDIAFDIVYNASIIGGFWQSVSNSCFEYDVTGNKYEGGIVIHSGYCKGKSGDNGFYEFDITNNKYPFGQSIDGKRSATLTIVASKLGLSNFEEKNKSVVVKKMKQIFLSKLSKPKNHHNSAIVYAGFSWNETI